MWLASKLKRNPNNFRWSNTIICIRTLVYMRDGCNAFSFSFHIVSTRFGYTNRNDKDKLLSYIFVGLIISVFKYN